MMMETMYDPYDMLFSDEQQSLPTEGLMFPNEIMLSDFNTDSSSISPIPNTTDYTENDFDATIFEDLVNKLFSSDPLLLKEQSIDLSFPPLESEPPTREIGTDPMEPVQPTLPIIIKPTNVNNSTNNPILFIRTINKTPTESVPLTTTEYYNFPIESSSVITNDYQMEDNLPLTPSSSSESPDETRSNSPDSLQNNGCSTMLTDLDNLPTSGSLVLTNEELKLIKQEGYQVPTKLPLNKTEEKMLKKIRRKIKNKISAQESRRKKKEYVDALEKQIAQYVNENNALKQRMTAIEKNQKSLTQERDLLRSMIGKGTTTTTPAPSTALMVFAVFFAVLFGIWSPITSKTSIDDKSLSLIPSSNYQSALTTQKPIFEQKETTHSNNYKSRVLLSIDEYENHHHGPYLPLNNNKYKSTFQQETAAPGYTYSNTVEKYMNKKISNEKSNINLKRTFSDESSSSIILPEEPIYKKLRSNYHVIEETNNELNESKPVKIIRVERTTPTIGNDTLKLTHRTINE